MEAPPGLKNTSPKDFHVLRSGFSRAALKEHQKLPTVLRWGDEKKLKSPCEIVPIFVPFC